MEIDIVCGMEVDPRSAERSSYEGNVFYFCSHECREEFEADPEAYVGAELGA